MDQKPVILCKGKEIDPSELPSCRQETKTTAQASALVLSPRDKRTHRMLPRPGSQPVPSGTRGAPQWWTALNCLSVWRLHQDRCVGKMFRPQVSRLPSLPLQVYGDDAIVALLETPVRKLAKNGRKRVAAMRPAPSQVRNQHQTQVTRSSGRRRVPRTGARLQLLRSLGRPQTQRQRGPGRSTLLKRPARCFATRLPMQLE